MIDWIPTSQQAPNEGDMILFWVKFNTGKYVGYGYRGGNDGTQYVDLANCDKDGDPSMVDERLVIAWSPVTPYTPEEKQWNS